MINLAFINLISRDFHNNDILRGQQTIADYKQIVFQLTTPNNNYPMAPRYLLGSLTFIYQDHSPPQFSLPSRRATRNFSGQGRFFE